MIGRTTRPCCARTSSARSISSTKPVLPTVLRAKVTVFIDLQRHSEELAKERIEREFDNRRRDFETTALRRERDREQAANQQLARLNEGARRERSPQGQLHRDPRARAAQPARAGADVRRSVAAGTRQAADAEDARHPRSPDRRCCRGSSMICSTCRASRPTRSSLRPERIRSRRGGRDARSRRAKPLIDERGHALRRSTCRRSGRRS